jgi:hypothetical protein
MGKYTISNWVSTDDYFISRPCKATRKNHYTTSEWFLGYDDMGTDVWGDLRLDKPLTKDEAIQIVKDLEAADEPDPNTEYLLKTVCDGIKQATVKTGNQIADIYEMDQLCGIYSSMEVLDLDTMKKLSLYGIVSPILAAREAVQREYRDYCENENY